ncbi:uncharacterized protein A4U43_C04F30980 [Asparagus officinalis]|uniref:Homeobox domain-containing protein n=1 Tax=Asparagus officinalis TaxID=4686 RepID=A0A5P1F9F4_ASPOF|nr:homeobox-leucine zipper protein ROC5-like [Asparagus officinalis]ONK73389.1 uncharacterized protein A4U43_C04F30980 [Asparagus officinalis]
MPVGSVISQSRFISPSVLQKPMFNSPGLSLGLQSNDLDGKGDELSRIMEDLDSARDEERESRSGSDHLDFASGDDLELENPRKRKKQKRYHRHTPQQIQELEALFKESPHPDEKQRMELSKRLNLEPRQVKFWFQNRRTQMKTQIERHENALLKQENEKLRLENITIRDAMRSPMCGGCGGPAILGELSLEEQQLRIENARLKDELDRVCALAGKFLGKPVTGFSTFSPAMPNSSLDLGFNGFYSMAPNLPQVSDFVASSSTGTVIDRSLEKSVLLELALAAMDELVKMVQMGEPLWIQGFENGKEALNYEEYLQVFPRCIGAKPVEFVSEATRETGMVIINSLALVEILMDANRWADMFPGMIANAVTTDIICSGVGGTRNGAIQLMNAELQVLSPLVPTRDVSFLRFCKQLAEGAWAVVDVSIDGGGRESSLVVAGSSMKCRRLPSGCVVQDMPNGYSKVTWVEHAEYDDAAVHQLYRPLLRSGMALGAHRWVATLQRRSECLAILLSSSIPNDNSAITPAGRRSMLKLAQRMMDNFCAGVCASSSRKWRRFVSVGDNNIADDVRVMTRQSLNEPGEPPGVVLSAATSVWVPVPERLRSQWDILSNGGPMQEMAHIAKGQHQGNAVSLLRASAATGGTQGNSMLILQETCTDSSGSMVVYAPVDVPAMHLVMNGGDSAYVALLPSGFSIVPDGAHNKAGTSGGSLLTVAFQILVNTLPSAKLTAESVETVNNLISCTVQKIKVSLSAEN